MKFSIFAVAVAVVVPSIHAKANIKLSFGSADTQMASLQDSIADIRAIAIKENHSDIVDKCDEATSHLNTAQGSWSGLASSFGASPWNAARSSHGLIVRARLSLCGDALGAIYQQPEMKTCSSYKQPVNNCKNQYKGCQKACSQVWNWPAPKPKPSQAHANDYYRRHKRNKVSACSADETSCPISTGFSKTCGLGSKHCECLDIQREIASCGGCVTQGQGENCLKITGAGNVRCDAGACIVTSAAKGYVLKDGRPQPETYA